MQVMKKRKSVTLLSEDERQRSLEMGHSSAMNMQNTFYIKTSEIFLSYFFGKRKLLETMASAEVYDLLRVSHCTHNEKLLFKNAVFKIITGIYSTTRKESS